MFVRLKKINFYIKKFEFDFPDVLEKQYALSLNFKISLHLAIRLKFLHAWGFQSHKSMWVHSVQGSNLI